MQRSGCHFVDNRCLHASECTLPFGICPIEERSKVPQFEEFLFSSHDLPYMVMITKSDGNLQ